MVFFNYATMQMAAKIVYYGPGLCGKTTNLHQIYQKTSPNTRGEMVSLETETDRTLFFDLLPLDAGIIGGFKTRLQLYTVPGQVFYNTTRQLVLKGADGIVFVADSQKAMLDANVDSLANLRENLTELGLDFDETPLVIQLNKRDLPNAVDKEILRSALDPHGVREFTEAAAIKGVGVFETLKLISRLTLKNLRTRMMGDQPPAATLAPIVRERGLETQRPQKATTPERPTPASDILESLLAEEEPAGPPRAAVDDAVVEEALPKSPEPEVKTVKVRSSVDVMAELDALRKKATQGKKRKEQPKIASKTMAVKATGKASEAKRVRLIVQLEDASGGVVQSNEDLLDVSGARTQTIDVKIEFESES